uniref:Uncharacterized protein n=1 Tax=Arundo donax TaxID=35708 RepID=A0A0A9FT62_ARUDO
MYGFSQEQDNKIICLNTDSLSRSADTLSSVQTKSTETISLVFPIPSICILKLQIYGRYLVIRF